MVSQQEEYIGDAELLLEKSSGIVEELQYTEENVEKILDELRPFLINDGGNVTLKGIDGPIVTV